LVGSKRRITSRERKEKKKEGRKRDKEQGMLKRGAKGKDDEGPSCLPGFFFIF
jgi:hypothetical protein